MKKEPLKKESLLVQLAEFHIKLAEESYSGKYYMVAKEELDSARRFLKMQINNRDHKHYLLVKGKYDSLFERLKDTRKV